MAEGLGKLGPNARQDIMSKMRQPKGKADPLKQESVADSDPMEVHDNGDGTYKTVKGGQEEQHPDLLHMTTHVAHAHEPDAKHFHAKHDGFEGHSHGISEDGAHEETQSHESPEDIGEAAKGFMGGGEAPQPHHESTEEAAPLGGM